MTAAEGPRAASKARRRRRSRREHIETFGDGRCCSVEGCVTTLSRYNGGDRCAAHDPAWY